MELYQHTKLNGVILIIAFSLHLGDKNFRTRVMIRFTDESFRIYSFDNCKIDNEICNYTNF